MVQLSMENVRINAAGMECSADEKLLCGINTLYDRFFVIYEDFVRNNREECLKLRGLYKPLCNGLVKQIVLSLFVHAKEKENGASQVGARSMYVLIASL